MSGVFLAITMYRILIVDDEIPFLESLAAFHWENYECVCIGKATNGEEALIKCMQFLPHIVITDINMPLLDGLSFLSKLHENFPEIQVILLTVHQKFDYARIAIQSGACDYVIKTMNYQENLIMALEKAKKYFINHSILVDSRYNLLYKGGRILIIESDEVINNYKNEIEEFFNKKYSTLISVYFSYKFNKITDIIEKIDSLPKIMEITVGIIIRGLSCVEFLTDYSVKEIKKRLLSEIQNENNLIINKNAIITITECNRLLRGYLQAHKLNEETYFMNFYKPLNCINISCEQAFTPLYSNTIFEWTHNLKENIKSKAQLNQYIGRLADECKKFLYHPNEVKKAFSLVLYKYESLYSISGHDNMHKEIMEAETITDLEKKMIDIINAIQNEENNYSYIVNTALEYIGINFKNANLQLPEVALYVGMSPGYLSKKLKEETGKTFQEILINFRMEHALTLLKNSSKKMYEVAEQVGYENYRSFVNAFSNYYGVNPKKIK